MAVKAHNDLARHLPASLRVTRREYLRALQRCRKRISVKAVHKLRVQTRRLLALLDFVEAAYVKCEADKTRKLLKKRLDVFDGLRDTQVQLELLEPLWTGFPEANPLRRLLEAREEKCRKRACKKVKRMNPEDSWSPLKKLEKKIRDAKPEAGADEVLQRFFDCVTNLRRQIHGHDPAAIHQVRVAFKRFRYACELWRTLLPWLTQERLRRMKKFQSSAGGIQDLEILLGTLDELVRKKKMSAGALRGLREELSTRKHRAVALFMKHIDELRTFRPPTHAT